MITNADLPSQHPSVRIEIVQVDQESPTLRAVRSALVVPIASGDRLHGLISLGRRLSGLPYATEDRRLLLVIANQIARFIESLKMINLVLEEKRTERELETAAEVQRRLFPSGGLEDDALEIYGNSIPALGVGGDYYDYFEMDARRTEIAIADVAGKGIAAALLMSTVQASLRCQLISKERPLTDVVSSMNRVLRRSTGDAGYVTFFLAEFDKETHGLTYVNAGHNPPMLVRRKHAVPAIAGVPLEARTPSQVFPNRMVGVGTAVISNTVGRPVVSLLPTGGPIIGTFLDEPYQQETIPLQSGDLLAVYTDGVTEALNPAGVEFGEEKLRSVLIESLNLPAREAARSVLAQVSDWQGRAPQHDDITLIVMKVK